MSVFSRPRVRAAVIGAAAAAVSVVVMSTPALAVKPVPIDYDKCPDFHICFFQAQFFGGSSPVQQPEQTVACVRMTGSANNTTTSIINATDHQYHVYDSSDCTGTAMALIYARTANDNIGSANNDRISSFKRIN